MAPSPYYIDLILFRQLKTRRRAVSSNFKVVSKVCKKTTSLFCYKFQTFNTLVPKCMITFIPPMASENEKFHFEVINLVQHHNFQELHLQSSRK